MTNIGRISQLDNHPGFNFRDLNRFAVGFDRIFDQMLSRSEATTSGYPPYNIIRMSENTYRIELALAGFSEPEVSVSVQSGVLTVRAEKTPTTETVEYLYKGIGCRSFTKTFQLSDHLEVLKATFSNGVLTIDLERQIPESQKPRLIPLTVQ